MADYYGMKDKMRRSAQDEQAARFMATTGNDPYAAEIIAAESRVPAPSRAAAPSAPQANVRGVPEGMTAEYYAPETPSTTSPADEFAARARMAYDKLSRAEGSAKRQAQDVRKFYQTAGTALGTAVGGGLGGPVGAMVGSPLGMGAGGIIGDIASKEEPPEYADAGAEVLASNRAIAEALRAGKLSQEELDAALKRQGLVWDTKSKSRFGAPRRQEK